jgi:hypothetical protein
MEDGLSFVMRSLNDYYHIRQREDVINEQHPGCGFDTAGPKTNYTCVVSMIHLVGWLDA